MKTEDNNDDKVSSPVDILLNMDLCEVESLIDDLEVKGILRKHHKINLDALKANE